MDISHRSAGDRVTSTQCPMTSFFRSCVLRKKACERMVACAPERWFWRRWTAHGPPMHHPLDRLPSPFSSLGTHLDKRVVFDRKRVTARLGVTAGIDLALVLATELAGEEIGRRIQLQMEYEPEPPFEGSPATAHRATVDALREPPADIAEQIRQIDRIAVAALTHT